MTAYFKSKPENINYKNEYSTPEPIMSDDMPLILTSEELDDYAKNVFFIGDVTTNVEDSTEELDVGDVLFKIIEELNNFKSEVRTRLLTLEQTIQQVEVDVTNTVYEATAELWAVVDDIEVDLEAIDEDCINNYLDNLELKEYVTNLEEKAFAVNNDLNGLYDQVNAIEEKLGAEEEVYEPQVIGFEDLQNVETLNLFYNSKIIYNTAAPDVNVDINLNPTDEEEDEEEFLDGFEGEFEDPDDEIYDETKWGSEPDEVI